MYSILTLNGLKYRCFLTFIHSFPPKSDQFTIDASVYNLCLVSTSSFLYTFQHYELTTRLPKFDIIS